MKKDGKLLDVEEDDPEVVKAFPVPPKKKTTTLHVSVVTIPRCPTIQFKQAVYKQTMKLFAELEIKRKEREAKEMHER